MIKLVNVNLIENHPDNPRKNLGDLTELADSIKETGILQNLTIVEQADNKGYYFTVIGNRRLAASKLAGLEEVPCAIVEMDHKTQLATMLLENMQRVDLTIHEQAQGFQMMLDVGESLEDIASKTGFSESTVRRRVKLLELDQDKLKEVSERQPNLTDFVELEKIKDLEKRNKAMESIGTSDFNYELKRALEHQEKEEMRKNILGILASNGAIEIRDRNNEEYITGIRYEEEGLEKIKELGEEIKYYKPWVYGLELYKGPSEKVLSEEEIESKRLEQEEKQKEEERRERLEEISERAYELRKDFVSGLSNTKARKNIDTIIEFTIYSIRSIGYVSDKSISKALNIEVDKEEVEWEDISKEIWKQPELNLLLAIYSKMEGDEKYYNWNKEYKENKKLDEIYKLLIKLGYSMSEEEKKLQDGSHELFRKE